jgi:flavin prenyltransferase
MPASLNRNEGTFTVSADPKTIVVGISGASGGAYALRLLDVLEAAGVTVELVVSPLGQRLLAEECGVTSVSVEHLLGRSSERLTIHNYRDVGSVLASGSYRTDGMVICPCSSNTLGAIAAGLGENLLWRAAQVTLKEARRLVLVHREMPLSGIDLRNMLRLQRAGAIICPAAPGFYLKPQTVSDLVDFVVGRVLDLLGVDHPLQIRWGGK